MTRGEIEARRRIESLERVRDALVDGFEALCDALQPLARPGEALDRRKVSAGLLKVSEGLALGVADARAAGGEGRAALAPADAGLLAALIEAEEVMARNVLPAPDDAPEGHPWRVLHRMRAAIYQAEARDPRTADEADARNAARRAPRPF